MGFERRYNEAFHIEDENAFVSPFAAINSSPLPLASADDDDARPLRRSRKP